MVALIARARRGVLEPDTAGRAIRRAAARVLAASDSALQLMRPILEQQAAERGRTLGAGHAESLAAENDLALSYLADAEQEQVALDHLEHLAADCAATLGPDHPDTLVVRGNLAVAQLAAGQTDVAAAALADVVADRTRVLGAGHDSTLNGRVALALARADEPDAAEHVAATLAAVVDRHGTRHPLARSCRALLDTVRGRPR